MNSSKIQTPKYEKDRLLFQVRLLNEFCDKAEQLSEQDVNFFQNSLPHIFGILPIEIKKWENPTVNFTTERLVINSDVLDGANKRLNSLKQLRYPPQEIASGNNYNRANLKGQSIFYGGSNSNLQVMIERPPYKGQLYTVSKWQLKKGHTLNFFAVCQDEKVALTNPDELWRHYEQHLIHLNQLCQNTKEVVQAFYTFVVKAFTREVNPENKQGYLFSALVADMIFRYEPKIDAIYYPSFPNKGSAMNIAVKPDSLDNKFEMIEASEYLTTENPNQYFPGWHSEKTARCKNYDHNSLTLNWEDNFFPPHDPVHKIIKQYNVDLT